MKSAKPLWRISVSTSREAEDAAAEMLGEILKLPVSTYFNYETQTSLVSVFSDKKFPVEKIRKKIFSGLKQIEKCGLKIGAGKIQIVKLKREDWAESWKKHFRAIEIGDSLLVKPSWIKKRPRKNQAVVVLDPGLSFGTGQHATTKFCLSEIARQKEIGIQKSFLDIGTGSGILAIAAVKLNFQPVCAFDFDPESIRVAKANARTNNVLKKIKVFRADVTEPKTLPKEKFDLVCANLISNLLIGNRKKIIARVKPNGVLVLAGILASEFLKVQRVFEDCGLKLIASKTEKEWRSGSFVFQKIFAEKFLKIV
jgi:ribosomal protein L11 methyltransferase